MRTYRDEHKITYRKKIDSSAIAILQERPDYSGFLTREPEHYKELLNLSTLSESQVTETLSFFSANPGYLQDKRYQALLVQWS